MSKRKYPIMNDEQLKAFYVAVLEIAAFEAGNRKKAKEMARYIMAEMLRRGI